MKNRYLVMVMQPSLFASHSFAVACELVTLVALPAKDEPPPVDLTAGFPITPA